MIIQREKGQNLEQYHSKIRSGSSTKQAAAPSSKIFYTMSGRGAEWQRIAFGVINNHLLKFIIFLCRMLRRRAI